jgi:hypothetical protein
MVTRWTTRPGRELRRWKDRALRKIPSQCKTNSGALTNTSHIQSSPIEIARARQAKAERINVKTGSSVRIEIEVCGDLQSGDVVVANATDSIRNGTAVSAQAK